MYWKFCAIAALGKVVGPGCWSATLGAAGVDCANTGALQATQSAAAAGMSRFIESSFVWSIGWAAELFDASVGRTLRQLIASSFTSITRYNVPDRCVRTRSATGKPAAQKLSVTKP
jgi:hypothetical protein